jgi:glycosyl transferase family 1/glycosyl transferase family 4
MDHLRLLHLDAGLTMRGGQWQVLRLLQGLHRMGHAVTLLTPALSALRTEALRAGLDARALEWGQVRMLSRGVELVHAHDARSHSLAALWSRAPLVVARRVAFPIRRGPASRWKYSRARHYIAVSDYVKGILEQGGVPGDRISIVPDGVPLFDPAGLGREVVIPESSDPRKGAALALEAARLAGVEARAAAALPEGLNGAGVFVYITHSEGLGSGILIAMSAGVPVIASRTGGVPEIVRDGVTGLLTPNDPAEIASRIRRLLGDRALALHLAQQARRMVEQEFSVEHMITRTLAVYEKVLA